MLNELSKEVHKIAAKKGWWDDPRPTFGDIIALCHAELSEALGAYRLDIPMVYYACVGCKDKDFTDIACEPDCKYRVDRPEGIAVELADCILHILDYCGHEGIDIDRIIREKIEYNKTRTYRHGGKRL